MHSDPRQPFDDRATGLAMLGTILFCALSGAGVGVFVAAPEIGLVAGGVVGIVAGLWLIPALINEFRD
jgi:hypothetical protein